MRTNQKYFACQDGEGQLSNRFVCVANIASSDPRRGRRRQREGARRAPLGRQILLGAGSEDPARGAGEEARPDRLPRKARHRRRQGRAGREARPVAGQRAAGARAPIRSTRSDRRAARQGRSGHRDGRRVPRAAGRDRRLLCPRAGPAATRSPTRSAIITSRPGRGTRCPTDPVTVAVNIADRLDTLVAFFSIGEKPTGSRDPFALRRAALGFLQLADQERSSPATRRRAGPGGGAQHRLAARRARDGHFPRSARQRRSRA